MKKNDQNDLLILPSLEGLLKTIYEKLKNNINSSSNKIPKKNISEIQYKNIDELANFINTELDDLFVKHERKIKTLKDICSGGQISIEDYEKLEKMIQKYESEIRNHIRTEQQLKFCAEAVQSKLEEYEKEKKNIEESLMKNNQNLKKELDVFKKKYNEILEENKKLNSIITKNKNKNNDSIKLQSLEKIYDDIKTNHPIIFQNFDSNLKKIIESEKLIKNNENSFVNPSSKPPHPLASNLLKSDYIQSRSKSIHTNTLYAKHSKINENNNSQKQIQNKIIDSHNEINSIHRMPLSQREIDNGSSFHKILENSQSHIKSNNNSFSNTIYNDKNLIKKVEKIEGLYQQNLQKLKKRSKSQKIFMNQTGYNLSKQAKNFVIAKNKNMLELKKILDDKNATFKS